MLEELRKLEAAAPPGPWYRRSTSNDGWVVAAGDSRYVADPIIDSWDQKNAAALIAAMRNALPLLLDVAEAAARVTYGWHAVLDTWSANASEAVRHLAEALAALESAQGAEQRPETDDDAGPRPGDNTVLGV